ncbi:MAG: 50S ribosomal protein L29 [Desulfobacterales bacterium]|nr:50S ribosomal protein L29 [Desulfobacterales bacterium]MDD4070802.1 50S ribosomal protein L29 [Desulfobacterales bacterium]MDD4391204.1 50S ribosomal protein L29 [Desulfobacterales bacterium]
MKASEFRQLSVDELNLKHKEMKEELFNLRFQHEVGQLENSSRLMHTKRDIARIQTVINEKNIELRQL